MRGTTIFPAIFAVLVLAALGYLAIHNRESQIAYTRKDRSDILAIERACEAYALDHGGSWPVDLAALLVSEPGRRPYLKATRTPLDPWGRPYRYEAPEGECTSARIWTCGRDGLPGGEGDDADVGNWMFQR